MRYRFFLSAGLLPYLLGAAWAYAMAGTFDGPLFWSGLGGVTLAVIGVECFNEFFDAQMGTDRIFNPADVPPVTRAVFLIGTLAFAGALTVGVYLAWRRGFRLLFLLSPVVYLPLTICFLLINARYSMTVQPFLFAFAAVTLVTALDALPARARAIAAQSR